MRAFTSVYQLLPIYPSLDVGGTYCRVAETDGIPCVDRRRLEQALSFHREIEKAVEAPLFRAFFVSCPIADLPLSVRLLFLHLLDYLAQFLDFFSV